MLEHLWKTTHLSLQNFSSTSWIFTRDVAVQLQRKGVITKLQLFFVTLAVDICGGLVTCAVCFQTSNYFLKIYTDISAKNKIENLYSFEFLKFNFRVSYFTFANIRQKCLESICLMTNWIIFESTRIDSSRCRPDFTRYIPDGSPRKKCGKWYSHLNTEVITATSLIPPILNFLFEWDDRLDLIKYENETTICLSNVWS